MGQRHRETGSAKPPKQQRRTDHRRERHETRQLLESADPDGVALPVVPHSHKPAPPAPKSGRRFRHWKAPFWKRRTAVRRAKAVAERAVD